MFLLAPIIATIMAFTAFSVIPLGGQVTIFGEETLLQIADLPVGLLVVRFAVPLVGVAALGRPGDLL